MRKDLYSPGSIKVAETPQQFLERIFCELPHFEGMFLITSQGEIVAHAANEGRFCENLPALTNEFLKFAASAAQAVRQGAVQYMLLKNEGGYLMILALDQDYVLVVLGRDHIRPDVIKYSTDWIASKLSLLLS
jgi:predicted regulator of Ras-like GTPase activity (Roadblock/LC7/MglB family)